MNTEGMKDFFANDHFAEMIGIEIESIAADEVVCGLPVETRHLNAGNTVQGGAIFTLADFTFAIACNYEDLAVRGRAATVGQSGNVTFLKPGTGKRLTARSRCIQKGKTLSVYRVAVTNDEGTLIAEMTANSFTANSEKK